MNIKNYLPSKKFIYLIIVIVVLGIIFFLIFNFYSQKKLFFFSDKESGLKNEKLTINDSLQKDTDNDGVVDWEETLWGTDKNKKATFDTVSDLLYIESKKKELNIDTTKDEQGLTETEKFAREFFATYVAMKTAGNDANTINNFSNALGQKIIYPSLIDGYNEQDIKINTINDTIEGRMAYYLNLKKIFESYESKGMGEELSIVANGLTSTTKSENYSKLLVIANAYQDFAKKIMEMSVPQSLISYHLKIANGSNNTGISVLSMTKIINDPIVGLSGLSQYEKYSDEFIKASEELATKILE
jgi:hypothetical protein